MADPFEVFGRLCANEVLKSLEPKHLAICCTVSRSWLSLAGEDHLWREHTEALWKNKTYLPEHVRALPAKQAYISSIHDAERSEISAEELCHFTWTFSFKLPLLGWWGAMHIMPPLQRYFNDNRTLTAPPGDLLWGNPGEHPRHYWGFRTAPDGSRLVQVNSYPALRCSRREDWGWSMENMMVALVSDTGAGPNPGLPAGHPDADAGISQEMFEAMYAHADDVFDDEALGLEDMPSSEPDTDMESTQEQQQEAERNGDDDSNRNDAMDDNADNQDVASSQASQLNCYGDEGMHSLL